MATLTGNSLDIPDCSLFKLFMEVTKSKDIGEAVLISERKKFTLGYVQALLNSITTQLLDEFCQHSINTPQILALLLPLSVKRVAAVLALLKIGCAFVSLDPALPPHRIKHILKDSQVKFIITEDQYQQILNSLDGISLNVLDISALKEASDAGQPNLPYSVPSNPLVTVLYTSGSTGEPKPVKLHTSNLLNRLMWYWEEFPFTPGELCCLKTSVLFVDSLTELLAPLLKAVPILILDRKDVINTQIFLDLIHEWKVTRLVLVPSQLHAMLALNDLNPQMNYLEHLKLVVSSGEELSPNLASSFLQATQSSQCMLSNFYGSTETTGDVTFVRLSSPDQVEALTVKGHLPIGKPVSNTQVFIEHVSANNGRDSGEIVISGKNLALCMATSKTEGNVFKTGDLGFISDGMLYYSGRKDSQVKIRGQRVDLKEIEVVAQRSCEHVQQVVTLVHGVGSEMQLTAFYQTKKTADIAEAEIQMKRACSEILPSYMVPRFHHLHNIPLQKHTGKIDKRALKNMVDQKIYAAGDSNPNMVLETLAKILCTPLSQLDINKTFFVQGGNSLSAVAAVTELAKNNCKIPLSDFLAAGSIQEIIERVYKKPEGDSTCSPAVSKELESAYSIEATNEDHMKSAVKLAAHEFVISNPMGYLLNISEENMYDAGMSLAQEFETDGLSFIVKSIQTQEIVGCSFILDAATRARTPHHEHEVIPVLIEAAEGPIRREVADGRWMDVTMLAVSSSLPADLKLNLLQMMEVETLRLAREFGYEGIITVNSHPVTMMVAESEFGYEVKNEVHMKSFEYKGGYPFTEADDDDYVIKCMVRYV